MLQVIQDDVDGSRACSDRRSVSAVLGALPASSFGFHIATMELKGKRRVGGSGLVKVKGEFWSQLQPG